jgi:hypothetical protein
LKTSRNSNNLYLECSTEFIDDENEISSEEPATTSQPFVHKNSSSNQENLLRYLAHIKHSVQDTGRPMYKSPDLQKIQTMVDKMKNIDLFNFDDEEKQTKSPEAEVDSPFHQALVRRNVFEDFSEKISKIGSEFPKRGTKSVDGSEKQKRKLNGLF